MLTDHQQTFFEAFYATAQAIVDRAKAEADPPDSYRVFRSRYFDYVVLDEMGSAWEREYAAIRRLDRAWSEVMGALRERVRVLEQEYHAWFEAGSGYDYEHIPAAPELDRTPRKIAWTNPHTQQCYAEVLQVGQVVMSCSRWVKYRVPEARWEKKVSWYEAGSGLSIEENYLLVAHSIKEKNQQDARALQYAEEVGALCNWEAFFTSPQKVQRAVRKRFLALREALHSQG